MSDEREVKPGQTWKSMDGGSLFKVAELGTDAKGRPVAKGASPDGSKPRDVQVARLLKRGNGGYRLIEE